MHSEYMQRFHRCELPFDEQMAVMRVRQLAQGDRRHPDVPPLPPEEACQPLMDPAEIDRFVSLGVITEAQGAALKTAKRGDTNRQPTQMTFDIDPVPVQESLF